MEPRAPGALSSPARGPAPGGVRSLGASALGTLHPSSPPPVTPGTERPARPPQPLPTPSSAGAAARRAAPLPPGSGPRPGREGSAPRSDQGSGLSQQQAAGNAPFGVMLSSCASRHRSNCGPPEEAPEERSPRHPERLRFPPLPLRATAPQPQLPGCSNPGCKLAAKKSVAARQARVPAAPHPETGSAPGAPRRRRPGPPGGLTHPPRGGSPRRRRARRRTRAWTGPCFPAGGRAPSERARPPGLTSGAGRGEGEGPRPAAPRPRPAAPGGGPGAAGKEGGGSGLLAPGPGRTRGPGQVSQAAPSGRGGR